MPYIGAIDVIFTDDTMTNVINFIGTSVGSIFASLFACRGDLNYMKTRFGNIDPSKLEDNSFGNLLDIYRLWTKFG